MHCTRPIYFSFGFGDRGREIFEFFLLFPMCSHCVPIKFAESSQCVPQDAPKSTTLLSHILWPKLIFLVNKL
jgi:hypothetical protein